MFDFEAWVRRAEQFHEGLRRRRVGLGCSDLRCNIYEPCLEFEVEDAERVLEMELPGALRRFLLTASSGCDCHYYCKPRFVGRRKLEHVIGRTHIWGGPMLCNILEIVSAMGHYRYWPHFPKQALHFAPIRNGDCLLLDLSTQNDDPPVLYWCHDEEDGSGRIAESFTSFLDSWERLCYIGPEHWLIDDFADEHGILNADSEKAQLLRRFFGK